MGPEEDIELIIEDAPVEETPAVEKVAEPAADPAPEPEQPSVEETLEALKRQVESEAAARRQAEQRASDAERRAHQESNRAHESDLNLVTNAIGTLEQTQDVLKSNLASAHAEQDYNLIADIQTAMANNAANLARLRDGKQAMEGAARPEAPAPVQRADDPVEAIAAQIERTAPRSAKWVRAHPEYARDAQLNARMVSAAQFVASSGVEVDSDEYFNRIESMLGIAGQQAAPLQRQAAPPAAPVSRGGNGTGSANASRVTLTPAEVEQAALCGMTEREYALEKLKIQRGLH